MTPAIDIQRLSKIFYPGRNLLDVFQSRRKNMKGIRALKSVSLQIRPGEIFVLLGPNGAGKTTLIKILSTLVLPDEGRVRVGGYDVIRHPAQAKSQISLVVGEERSFYWRLTGRQNLEFFAALYDLDRKKAAEKIKRAAGLFELDCLDQRYQEYSTGTKQRLALARSFLSDARILLMDEPSRSLDPNAAEKLRRLIVDLKENHGKTVFLATHHMQEAEALADRIAVLDHGEIKACGTLEELRNQAGDKSAALEELFGRITHDGTIPERLPLFT